MPDDLDPRISGEYTNELIIAGLEAYDRHKALLLKNITQSGYTLGNVPVADSLDRAAQLQFQAQDPMQPPQTRVSALRELVSMRGVQNA